MRSPIIVSMALNLKKGVDLLVKNIFEETCGVAEAWGERHFLLLR